LKSRERIGVDTFERRVQPFIMVVPCGQLLLVPPAEIERWIKANARYLVDQVA
jgi:hypothetical protein